MNEAPFIIPPRVPFRARVSAADAARHNAAMLARMADDQASPADLDLMRATFQMTAYATKLMEDLAPAEIRKRAKVMFRCQDCNGRSIGWIVTVDGRDVFVGEAGDGMAVVFLLDAPGFAAPKFQCRRATFRLTSEMTDGRNAEVRLSHQAAAMP